MTRVLQVLGRSAGGIARHVSQLAGALDGRDGLTIDVACPPDLPIPMPKPSLDLVVPDGLRGHGPAIAKLRGLVKEHRYDLVHAHGLRAGIDSAVAARGLAQVVVTVHNLVRDDIAGRRAPIDRLAEPAVVRLSDRTLAVSRDIAAHLVAAARSSAHKVEVLYLGVGDPPQVRRATAEVRAELGLRSADRCLLVTVARLAPQKALPVMFEAVAGMSPRPLLAVLGEGPLEGELRERVADLALEEDVRFLGFRGDVADVVAAADVFCLSSTWEGVPLSVQEAILLGTVVVGTDVGGMSEVITDRETGRLVAAGDSAGLRAAVAELCGSPELRERYATRAREALVERFSTTAMLQRLSTLYRDGVHAT
ncbi:MAG: glycosyltransferase family 4 protein [Actinomycetota bacterium]|nr:glycosyltransferase family 4 protein [Actinomycetota bacterium]